MSPSRKRDMESGLSEKTQTGSTQKLQKNTVGLQLIYETTGTVVLTW